MNLLSVLAQPWFVIAWYGVGFACAVWVVADEYGVNTNVPTALKWCWPIIVLFFSVIGLAIYVWACRPPGIAALRGVEAKRAYEAYAGSTMKKVTGSVIHCVGGDGLGIITAMVIARLVRMAFWQEFWFEYAAGFALAGSSSNTRP